MDDLAYYKLDWRIIVNQLAITEERRMALNKRKEEVEAKIRELEKVV